MHLEKENVETPNVQKNSQFLLRLGLKEMWMIVGVSLVVFIILVSIVFFYMGKTAQQENVQISKAITLKLEDIELQQTQQKHFLVSQITYGEERQRVILFIRDMVYEYWQKNKATISNLNLPEKDFSIDKAFSIAQRNVEVAEIYPSVDALMLTSIQFQESRWGIYRESKVGAIGLNHIMPMTGKLLANAMGISFSIEMLDDDLISTEMSAKYLDLAYSIYGDWEVVMAEYNGGPWGAYYYKTKNPKLHEETAKYVPEVKSRWDKFREKLKEYQPEIKSITMYDKESEEQ